MKKLWKQIPLKPRLLILLSSGIILLVTQRYYYHFFIMITGMVLPLLGFFSLQEAEARDYDKQTDKMKLFIVPLGIGSAFGICGFVITGNILIAIFSMFLGVGMYTVLVGEILLVFSTYKVYKDFYAYYAGGILMLFSFFLLFTIFSVQGRQVYAEPSGSWEGQYKFPGSDVNECKSAHLVLVDRPNDKRSYRYGQYRVVFSSEVDCQSDSVVGVPLYDDYRSYAVEKGDSLIIWDDSGKSEKDTLCILERGDGSISVYWKSFEYKSVLESN